MVFFFTSCMQVCQEMRKEKAGGNQEARGPLRGEVLLLHEKDWGISGRILPEFSFKTTSITFPPSERLKGSYYQEVMRVADVLESAGVACVHCYIV